MMSNKRDNLFITCLYGHKHFRGPLQFIPSHIGVIVENLYRCTLNRDVLFLGIIQQCEPCSVRRNIIAMIDGFKRVLGEYPFVYDIWMVWKFLRTYYGITEVIGQAVVLQVPIHYLNKWRAIQLHLVLKQDTI